MDPNIEKLRQAAQLCAKIETAYKLHQEGMPPAFENFVPTFTTEQLAGIKSYVNSSVVEIKALLNGLAWP